MIAGLSACLLITFANFYFFSTALLTPIKRESTSGTRTFDILTGEYEINMKILVNNRMVAFAILGYGAVTSLVFIFVAMVKSLGKNSFPFDNKQYIFCYWFYSGASYYNYTKEIRSEKNGKSIVVRLRPAASHPRQADRPRQQLQCRPGILLVISAEHEYTVCPDTKRTLPTFDVGDQLIFLSCSVF